MPFSPFTNETVHSERARRGRPDLAGRRRVSTTRSSAGTRDVRLMIPHLESAGDSGAKQRIGKLDVIVLRCREVRQVASEHGIQRPLLLSRGAAPHRSTHASVTPR